MELESWIYIHTLMQFVRLEFYTRVGWVFFLKTLSSWAECVMRRVEMRFYPKSVRVFYMVVNGNEPTECEERLERIHGVK